MSPVISGLLGGLVAVALAAVAQRTQRSSRMGANGWRVLRPSWLLHGTFVACVTFTTLIAYFLLSGGSTRPDAETQNLYAGGLAAACAVGVLYVGWTSYGRTIAWRDNELRARTIFGHDLVKSFSDVRSIKKSEARGDYRIKFLDGSTLAFSAYLHGARELVEQLPETRRNG